MAGTVVVEWSVHIFIDESGTFTPSPSSSAISLVRALIIPTSESAQLEEKYARLRPQLLKDGNEVKGRQLSESDVASVVTMLRRHDVLLEVTAIDMGMHDTSEIIAHKKAQAAAITGTVPDHAQATKHVQVRRLRQRLEAISPQLYVQSVLTFDLIERVIEHGTMYYSQRRPRELDAFRWVIDAKGKGRITEWEDWWSFFVMPVLQSKSLRRPMKIFAEGDYSHFHRLSIEAPDHLKPHTLAPRRTRDVTKAS